MRALARVVLVMVAIFGGCARANLASRLCACCGRESGTVRTW
jgi:hypothetical protein